MSRKPPYHQSRTHEARAFGPFTKRRDQDSLAGFSIEDRITSGSMPDSLSARSGKGKGSNRKASASVASPYHQSSLAAVSTGNFYGNGASSSSTTASSKVPKLALSPDPPSHKRWPPRTSADEPSMKSSAKALPLISQPQHRDAGAPQRVTGNDFKWKQVEGNDLKSAIELAETDDEETEASTSRGITQSQAGPSKTQRSPPPSSWSPSVPRKRNRPLAGQDDSDEESRPLKRNQNPTPHATHTRFPLTSPVDDDWSRDEIDCLSRTPEAPRAPNKRHSMLGKQPASTSRPPQDTQSPTRAARKTTQPSVVVLLVEVGDKIGVERHQGPQMSLDTLNRELCLSWPRQPSGPLKIAFDDLEEVFALQQPLGQPASSSRPPFLGLRTEPASSSTKALDNLFGYAYDAKMSGSRPPIVLWGKEDDRATWQTFVKALANHGSNKMRYINDTTAANLVGHPETALKKRDQLAQKAEQRRASQSPKMASKAGGSNVPRSQAMQPRHTKRLESPGPSDGSRSPSPPPLQLRASRAAGATPRDASPSSREPATYGNRSGLPRRQSARIGGSLKLPNKEGSPIPLRAPARPPGAPDTMKLRYPFEGPGSVSVFESDVDRLVSGEFLNDTLVEFGLKFHLDAIKAREPVLYEKLYVFNSFFYRQLRQTKRVDDCYQQVRKWTSKIDVFAKDYLVIPINENLHWYLAIVVNPGLALDARESSAEPRESTPPAGATRARKSLPGNVSINNGNRTINSDGSDVEAGDNGNTTIISSRATSPASVRAAEQSNAPPVSEMQQSYSQLKIGADEAVEEDEVDEIESDGDGGAGGGDDSAMATRLPIAASDSIDVPSQQEARATQSDDIQPSSRTETANFPFKPEFKPDAPHPVIDLSGTQEDDDDDERKDVEMVDGSSNIANKGRGSLVGGGDAPRRRPAVVVPGESMARAISNSPPLSHAPSRPKPRPSAGHGGAAGNRTAGSSRGGGAAGGAAGSSRMGGNSKNAGKSPIVIDVDGTAPPSTTPRTSPNVTKTTTGARAGPSTSTSKAAPAAQQPARGKRAEETFQKLRGLLQDEVVVLTFDSLGGTHPSVTKTVNEYLRCEALDKRKIRINPQAKTISVAVPEQPNYSDCGLYVMLYFERFFRHLKEVKETVIPSKDKQSELWGADSASKARREWSQRINQLSAEWKKQKEAGGSGGVDDDEDEGFEEALPGGEDTAPVAPPPAAAESSPTDAVKKADEAKGEAKGEGEDKKAEEKGKEVEQGQEEEKKAEKEGEEVAAPTAASSQSIDHELEADLIRE